MGQIASRDPRYHPDPVLSFVTVGMLADPIGATAETLFVFYCLN